jgi:hypothetical protein
MSPLRGLAGYGLGAAAPSAPSGTGQALLTAASALDDLLQQGAPPYVSGQGPSNPTVLAFQTAWNADPAVNSSTLQLDGEYGVLTMGAMQQLGYTEPQPVVQAGGSGTGGTAQGGATDTTQEGQAFQASILGLPQWAVIGIAAVAGVAIIGSAVASQHGPAMSKHTHRVTKTVRRHARRLTPRRRRR